MKKWIKSIVIYCLGFFILSLGVSFSIISDLGVSPASSIPYVLSLIFDVEMGICTTSTLLVFMLIQVLMLRKDYKIRNLLQILGSTLFGLFVNITNSMTASIDLGGNYILQLLFIAISIVLISIGVMLYLAPNIMSLPAEGVMQAMTQKFEFPQHKSKIIFDSSVTVIAIALSFIFLHGLFGVREGTIISAICVGACLKFLKKIVGTKIEDFINN